MGLLKDIINRIFKKKTPIPLKPPIPPKPPIPVKK